MPTFMWLAICWICIAFAGWCVWAAIRYRDVYYLVLFLIPLYTLGVMAKQIAFGPDFVRFYLGDFAWPAVVAVILTHLWMLVSKSPGNLLAREIKEIKLQRVMLVPAAISAVVYEVAAHYAQEPLLAAGYTNIPIGSFDWVDMLMTALGCAVVLLLLNRKLTLQTREHNRSLTGH